MEAALVKAAYASLGQRSIKPLTDQLAKVTGHSRTTHCEYNAGDTLPHRFEATGGSAEDYSLYFSHYHKENIWLKARMAETSENCFFVGSRTIPDAQLKQSTWYREFMLPRELADVVSFGSRCVSGKQSYLNILSSKTNPEFSNESLQLLRAVSPHINKVLDTRRHMSEKTLESLFLRQATTSRQQAHFLLDTHGRVVLKTPMAEDLIEMQDGFSMAGDRLTFDNYASEQDFDRSFNQTIKAMNLSTELALPLRIPRKSGGNAYVFDFCPWAVQNDDLLPSETYIMVTAFVPHGRISLREELIQAGYKLTPSETKLAADLVDGIDLKAISEARQLSLATLRNHLKSIYAKTGIHRQGELVSEMARFLSE